MLKQQTEDTILLGETKKNLIEIESEINALENRKKSLNNDIKTISQQATNTADEIYKKSYDLMQEKLSQSAQLVSEKFQKEEEKLKQEYLKMAKEQAFEFSEKINKNNLELILAERELNDLKKKISAVIESSKKQSLEENEKSYYQIKISEEDLEDIRLLKEVVKKLNKDPEPVNKVIWELYYKKPTLDLLGRIAPTDEIYIGIYKITNIKTNQCYIGQSLNIRNRLREHIKAGLGISSSNNRFYSEMKAVGPENFMYEILEKCTQEELNEKERY